MKKVHYTPILRIVIFTFWLIAFLSLARLHSLTKLPTIPSASAHSNMLAQNATLVIGTSVATSNTNSASWKGTLASDNAFWSITRVAATPSLDVNFSFPNIQLYNANKLLITIEDANVTTATAYIHQICDWTSSANVDNIADTYCTGGGWRTLQPRKTTHTNTADTSRVYEIYNGYFWVSSPSPGTAIDTPLVNFVNTTNNNTVLIRTYSAVSATTQYNIDHIKVEPAIDPIYEPAGINLTATGTTTNSVAELIGANSTTLTASDNTRLTIPMPAISTALDTYFTFKDVRAYPGMNTFLVTPELCVSNAALTLSFWLYNFSSTSWTQISASYSPSVCATDTDYALSYNSTSIGGFDSNDYISPAKEVRFRILSNTPGVVYNTQIDRLYMTTGTVNTDSVDCEISFGTGTASNCTNTRQIKDVKTAAPSTSTWQATAELEYPASFYSLDNDDDATNAEYATSQNLSFPVAPTSAMTVTGIHYATKYRSNSTAQTMDLGIRDYSGTSGVSGWVATPGTDTNALTTYSWFDTWVLAELQTDAPKMIDTVTGKANLRARTSAGTTTNPGTRDWAFAMMSIRWVEDSGRSSLKAISTPTGGSLITGTETATGQTNTGSWRGTIGNDSATNGGSNYWIVQRATTGLNAQLYFDNVELYNANKMIIRTEMANITTANNYVVQICDWTSATGVDNSADTECTGGGWRTLHPLKTQSTVTTDTTVNYHIYDGYFWNTTTPPGTKVSTPLTNFTRTSDKRVLTRVYSVINSAVQLRIDFVQIEVAIDPTYSPAAINRLNSYSAAITGSGDRLVGTTGSDGSKMILTNSVSNPIDIEYVFTNVKPFSGANTILVRPETCASNVALTTTFAVYNYSTTSWTNINTTPITPTACNTDSSYSLALSGISLNDYIQAGELKVRMFTATSNAFTFSIDRLYIMLGSTNTDTSDCEISFGTGTATDCGNTATVNDADTVATASTATWQQTSALEYPASFYTRDNDFDATNAEAATSSILPISINPTNSMAVTAIGWAVRSRSNITTMTHTLSILNESGGGSSGWTTTGYTNATTTYSASDSFASTELLVDPSRHITTDNSLLFRLHTTASTSVAAGTVRDLDFVMGSIRYLLPTTGILTTDIVDGTGTSVPIPGITFSGSQVGFSCQITAGTFGTSTEKIRITNSTSNAAWVLSIAASSGITSLWTSGGDTYDFNDTSGSPSGCGDGGDADSASGKLSFDFTSAIITPQGGCSTTGITLGSNADFSQGITDSIVIAQASAGAQTNCYWDITGIVVQQSIPVGQISGTYSLNTNLTIAAN